jgi:hypothetical protein
MLRQVVFSALITGIAGASLLGGCAAGGDEAILVLSNVLAGDNCTTTAGGSQTVLGHGSLETLLVSDGYLFFADLKSRITALEGQEDQRTIIVTGANVDVTFPGSTLFSDADLADLRAKNLTHFNQAVSTAITPNGGTATIPFILIPSSLVDRIVAKAGTGNFRIEALATFTMLGSMSGERVESQAFSYGVTIGTFLTVIDNGPCAGISSSFVARVGYSCNPAQDGLIDCCEAGNALSCPAKGP